MKVNRSVFRGPEEKYSERAFSLCLFLHVVIHRRRLGKKEDAPYERFVLSSTLIMCILLLVSSQLPLYVVSVSFLFVSLSSITAIRGKVPGSLH